MLFSFKFMRNNKTAFRYTIRANVKPIRIIAFKFVCFHISLVCCIVWLDFSWYSIDVQIMHYTNLRNEICSCLLYYYAETTHLIWNDCNDRNWKRFHHIWKVKLIITVEWLEICFLTKILWIFFFYIIVKQALQYIKSLFSEQANDK